MPTLDWIGKDKVINHHMDVPYRVLNRVYSYDLNGRHSEDNGSENKIIHGDNLEALKSLLPEYAGRIKCIYIDPPYNTGNEGWVYNDNVNDPKIKKWLGEVVGKEGEDLSRHDKWLCMMYPRLRLLHKLLAKGGAIFISIDDNELCSLKMVCDEIFGRNCFVADISWQRTYSTRNDSKGIVSEVEHILVYSGQPGWNPKKLPRTEEMDSKYKNPDHDIAMWRSDNAYAPGAATHQGSEKKRRICKDKIIKRISRINAVNDAELDEYVSRIMQNMTEDQLTDLEQSHYLYTQKIYDKVRQLLNAHAKDTFYKWIEQDMISCRPLYSFPAGITAAKVNDVIPKSLYTAEEDVNGYESRVAWELSALSNIRWWHRNISRRGFAINGAVTAYPDLIVMTESGKLLLVETKGDHLKNDESREKAEIGAIWAAKASQLGRIYKYFMVYETKKPEYAGAYSHERFMEIVRGL